MNVVITGTSRGIGLELVKQGVEQGHKILAVARNVQNLKGLPVETLAVDLTEAEAPSQIAQAVSGWAQVDLLINNAGIYLKDSTPKDFLDTFRINSVAPFFVTQALLPQLKRSSAPKSVHITSQMGSIADNSSGGSYSYRASKAALNMINRSLSLDNPWLTTVVVHPGWVQTDMGGTGAPTSVEESARGIWQVINHLKPADSGRFLTYSGKDLPW